MTPADLARLRGMSDSSQPAYDWQAGRDDPSGRLADYVARTQTPLDLLALLTLWLVVVPPGDFGSASTEAVVARLILSGVYAVDIAVRTWLAPQHRKYLRTHWLGLLVVVLPPVRIIFSLRLVRAMFQRGHLGHFLVAAALLVVNGAAAVYFYERYVPGSNIHTLGESIWWSVTTVSTVGYGDYYPVTAKGQVAAGFIMAIGILTLAVVTAQVSSSFVEQAARRRAQAAEAKPEPISGNVTLNDLAERLARIEELLSPSRPDRGSTPDPT
jgi:voltage-gated potassium channel